MANPVLSSSALASVNDIKQRARELSQRDPDHKDTDAWIAFGLQAYNLFKDLKEIQKDAELNKKDTNWFELVTGTTKQLKDAQVSKKSLRLVQLLRQPRKELVAYIPFSNSDPAWLEAAVVGLSRLSTKRNAHFVDPAYHPGGNKPDHELPDGPLRVAIVGDLGTNDKHHRAVLSSIAKMRPDLVIHLGDIYISGTSEECNKFWDIYKSETQWEKPTPPPLWSLPGNHEYIDAGVGYFQLVNSGVLGGGHQRHSFFSLESTKLRLQLIGLDTGFNSSNFTLPLGNEARDYTTELDTAQAEWAAERLRSARKKGLRTIVLTHHPYFSAYWTEVNKDNDADGDGIPFNDKLGNQILGDGKGPITAWLWGHDHRFIAYDKVNEITQGKLAHAVGLGFGACPVEEGEYANPNPVFPIKAEYRPDVVDQYHFHEGVYNNGFAILEVTNGDTPMNLSYYQVDRRSAPDAYFESFGSTKLN